MNLLYLLAGIAVLGLSAYLAVALLNPEALE